MGISRGGGLNRRAVPARALALSLAALALPAVATAFMPSWLEREGALLIWLPAIVPAFLLTYYRGWQGASQALAGAMAALALTQVGVIAFDLIVPSWSYVFTVVVILLSVTLGAGWMAEALLRARETAEAEAFTDTLTGLANRRHASFVLDTAWGATLHGAGLAIVIFDLDHFKQVNDTHGHAEGDRVLKAFGEVLAKRTRRMDLSARFGGEEFISILHGCPVEHAAAFAEQVRAQFGALDFGWGQVTASAGVAAVEEGMGSPDVLVAAADRALYAAKGQGRNRVGRADELAPRAPKPPALVPAELKALTEIRVLVVDDDPNTVLALGEQLTSLGSSVTLADSAREAVGILHSGMPFDVLATGIVMPEMSGFTLVESALTVVPDLRVLYISGYEQDEVFWGGLPDAKSTFLTKPIAIDRLVGAVTRLLDPHVTAAEPSRPAPASAPATTRGARAERAGDNGAPPHGRVLVIDDDPNKVQALVRLFREAGYPSPIGLTDFRKVGDVLRLHEVDLVIFDLHTRNRDSREALAALFGPDKLRDVELRPKSTGTP